jgi:hypothetical protein
VTRWNIEVSVDAKGVVKGAKVASQAVDKMGRKMTESERRMAALQKRMRMLAQTAGLIVGPAIVGMFGRKAIQAAITQSQAIAGVEQAIKSTGFAARLTSQDLQKIASDIQKIGVHGDESILKMQGLLLTFKSVKGDNFQRASELIADMSIKMGSLESNALLLGKALDDPARRASELSRQGIVLTETQKELIRKFEETGQRAKAQAIILDEVATQFGGLNQAAAEAAGGGIEQLKNALGDLMEVLGGPLVKRLDATAKGIKELAETDIASAQVRALAETIAMLADGIAPHEALFLGAYRSTKRYAEAVKDAERGVKVLVDQVERFKEEGESAAEATEAMDKATQDMLKDAASPLEAQLESVNTALDAHKVKLEEIEEQYRAEIQAIKDWLKNIQDLEANLAAFEGGTILEGAIGGGDIAGWESTIDAMIANFDAGIMESFSDPGLGQALKNGLTPAFVASFTTGIVQALASGDTQRAIEQFAVGVGALIGAAVGPMMGLDPATGAQIGGTIGAIIGGLLGDSGPGQTKAVFGFGEGATMDASGQRLDQFNALLQELNRTFAELERTIGGTIELTRSFEIAIKENGEAWLRLYDDMGQLISSTPFDSFEQALTDGLEHVMTSAIVNAAGPVGDAVAELFSMASERGFEQTMQDIALVAGAFQSIDQALGNFTLAGDAVLSQLDDLRFALSQMGLSAAALAPILDRLAAAEEERMQQLRHGALGRLFQMAVDAGFQGAKLAQHRAKLEQSIAKISLAKLKAELKMLGIFHGFVKKLWKRLKKWIKDLGNFDVKIPKIEIDPIPPVEIDPIDIDDDSRLADALRAARDSIIDFLKGMAFGSTSALSPHQRFNEAMSQFQNAFELAKSGDLGALQDITKYAQTLLQEGRSFYGSSEGFANLFFMVNRMLSELTNGEGALNDTIEATAAKQLKVQEDSLGVQSSMLGEIMGLRSDLVAAINDVKQSA